MAVPFSESVGPTKVLLGVSAAENEHRFHFKSLYHKAEIPKLWLTKKPFAFWRFCTKPTLRRMNVWEPITNFRNWWIHWSPN